MSTKHRRNRPLRVEFTSAAFGHLADGDDSVAIDADIRRDRFRAEPVDDETMRITRSCAMGEEAAAVHASALAVGHPPEGAGCRGLPLRS